MKFHVLTLMLLHGASATLSGDGSTIRGRKATEGCGPCSHEVCAGELNACPHTNPFICLAGKAKSGCTAIESIWLNPEDCHECCDLSHCSEEEPPEPEEPNCGPCSHEVCASELNACPHTNPFVCLEGNAKSGCTADEEIWPNLKDCHDCCDLSHCPEETPKVEPSCEPCSHEVCASELNACPHTNPFVCLAGKAKSGCTAIEHIWLNPEDCHECCDLSHCSSPPKEEEPPKVEPPKEELPKEEPSSGDLDLYADTSGDTTFFNLDEHCHPDAYCIGTVVPFKNKIYYDKHLSHYAGHSLGECIVVATHTFYCTFSVQVKHKGEIAVQGFGDLGPDGTTFLITAASGIYKGEEGTLTSTSDETKSKYYKYSIKFYDSASY